MVILNGCNPFSFSERKDKTDMRIFYQTPAWNLVKAIENDDSSTIKDLIYKNPKLLNFQEPVYGISLIQRAVGRRKYVATKTLIELGVDLNLQSKIGDAPIFDAIGYRWGDNNSVEDNSMLQLLLESGANPNIIYNYGTNNGEEVNVTEYGTTPLMYAIAYSYGYQFVQLLVKYGAEIDAKTPLGTTAAIEALRSGDIKSAYYLIVLHNAKITEPYFYYKFGTLEVDVDNPHYPIDLLLSLTYELDSKEYIIKNNIINKFEQYGIHYQERKNKIPKTILEKIKRKYPNTWKEYIIKY